MSSPIDVDVRRITPDELIPWLEAMATTFLSRPDIDRVAEHNAPYYDFERTWAAFDHGHARGPVGTLRSWATELTVPGDALVPAAAVAAVTVLPSHRRRGILRRMIAAEHEAARERGEAVAILYASEASIYGRFGYGVGVIECDLALDTRSTGFVATAAAGGVSIAPNDELTATVIRDLHDRYRRTQVGEIRRRDHAFAMAMGLTVNGWEPPWKGWVAMHRDAGGDADGYVRYGAELRWDRGQPQSIVSVRDLVALGDEAYEALWRWVAELDLVATVNAERRSPFERLPWLLSNRRSLVLEGVGDGLWVCLLDVPVALAARAYQRTADLVIEVVETAPGTGRTRIRLEASPDGVACATTSKAPDLTVHLDALGAAYLGGTPLGEAARGQGFEEHRPGSLAEADALLRTLDQPRCGTFF